jgi:hypothetical protein
MEPLTWNDCLTLPVIPEEDAAKTHRQRNNCPKAVYISEAAKICWSRGQHCLNELSKVGMGRRGALTHNPSKEEATNINDHMGTI